MKRCMGCMEEYDDEFDVCPHCGFAEGTEQENALHMMPGSILEERYIVGKVIGYGGFGVTYIGWDCLLETKVAIKEYLPSEFSTRVLGQTEVTVFSGDKQEQFADGLRKFTDEAKKLAKYHSLNGIVKIFDSIETNNTAYIIMELLEGETLAEILKREERFSENKTMEMMIPIIESLDLIHNDGIIHRDIAPDNIFVTTSGEVKLIDFGAARYATTTHSRSLTVIIKPGYSPEEQYRSRGDQGPHTDVYAVAATMYKMLTGVTPPDALERRALFENKKKDILDPIRKHCKEISESRENAILNALNVRIEDRTPDMKEFMAELTSVEPVKRRAGNIKKIDLYKWPVWAKIAFSVITAALIVFNVLFINGINGIEEIPVRIDITIPDGQTRVPSVVNKSYARGEISLTEKKLNAEISDRVPSDKIDKDLIMYQSINGGAVVQENSVVNLVVSGGVQFQPVPDIMGLSKESAEKQLEDLGFAVLIEEAYDDTIAEGYVVSQSAAPDTEAKEGSEITLKVSKGRDPSKKIEEKDVTLTNLIGMKYEDALKEAQRLGVTVKVTEKRYSSNFEKNTVMHQDPDAGTTVKNTSSIELIVSLGYSKIIVPDVRLFAEEKAVSMLEGRGLRCNVIYEQNGTVAAGHVISQDPVKDTKVDPETLVTLTVSTGAAEFDMPDVVGESADDAKSILETKGLVVLFNYEKNLEKPEGTVLMQSVKTGSGVKRGDNIILTVSTHSDTITVPYLVGKTQKDAEKEIREAGLKVNVITVQGSAEDKGKVVAQSPTAGSGLRKGDTLSISISDGGTDATDSSSKDEPKEAPEDLSTLTVKISESTLTLESGESKDLSYTTDTAKWMINSEEWTTSNSAIATVDGKGKVTAVASGTAKITVTLKGKSSKGQEVTRTASCDVTVNAPVQPEQITLSSTALEMNIGDKSTLKATVMPEDAKNKDVTWSTSNNAVATVENGYVTAIKEGTATITAETFNGKKATCTITVMPPVPTAITLNSDSISLGVEETATLTATIVPANARDKTVTWHSSDEKIATVTNGLVKAISKGEATITATSSNGLKAECAVKVYDILPNSITLNETEIDLLVDDEFTLTATVKPENAIKREVFWSTGDSKIATVDNGVVKAVNEGKVTITAQTENNVTATCTVNVKPILPTSISIPSKITLAPGDETTLEPVISPSNTTNKTVTWKSNDEKVVKIVNGKIQAQKTTAKTTSATITASIGSVSAKCVVEVKKPDVNITDSRSTITIYSGQTVDLEAEISDFAQDKTISWSAFDTSKEYIYQKGSKCTIIGLEPTEKTTVTANSSRYNVFATCTIEVRPATAEIYVKGTDIKGSIEMNANEEIQLDVSFIPEGFTKKDFRWMPDANAEGVITIDSDGLVKAVGPGTARVTTSPLLVYKGVDGLYSEKTIQPEYITITVRNMSSTSMGKLGDSVTWQLTNGTLEISGSGEMVGSLPEELADQVEKVVIKNGITSVSENAFSGFGSIKSVSFASSVETIEAGAFRGCSRLESVTIPKTVTYIGDKAFGFKVNGDRYQDFIIYCSSDSAARKYADDNFFLTA